MLQGPEARFSSEGLGRYGRYRVERLIGSGSAGAVFLGRDPILGRPVAIKVVPLRTCRSAAEKAERMDLLRRAFGPLGSLAHQNLVTVHDVGIEDEHSFLVMEYVPGRDLASHLAEGLLAPERVGGLGTQLAQALDFAHGHDLTHGDLKPTNVIVTPGWEVKLTDLGVVSALAVSGLGHANSRWDSPDHLAPEVTEGKEPSPASDRFALGALLYSLLTGRPPFHGDDATATLWRIASEQPPLPSDLAPELPVAVDAVFLRALAKDPRDRFSTCSELAEALCDALAEREPPRPAVFATQPLDEALRRELRLAGSATKPVEVEHARLDPRPPAATAPVRRARRETAPGRRRRIWPWAALLLLAFLGLAAFQAWRSGAFPWLGGQPRSAAPPAGREELSWDAAPTSPSAPERAAPVPTTGIEDPPSLASAGTPTAPSAVPGVTDDVDPEPEPVESGPAPMEGVAPADEPATPIASPEGTANDGARLRIRLASEVETGDVAVWADDRVLLERRFHFGGPLQRLRREAAPGGQWEQIVPVEPGLTFFRVRVALPSGTTKEIPLRRTLQGGEEHVLEITISPHREIDARWR